ncbi:unnamed protein product [Nippostrongylus brasiliensis]|uniref:AflR domain-containing protein n=1 Tax=Nippostrongylus brasiliensis TaxID=27835 RepID=A0A0N4Y755_NIPBR|nr:unnamed protein product [Nippostrongylus brasiliensis]
MRRQPIFGLVALVEALTTEMAAFNDAFSVYFKPKLSLSAQPPDMGNQQGRRLSRAAIQMENGETSSTLADSLKLTQYQIQLLQSTWSKLKSTSTFTQVFKLLCFKSTTSREMFQKMSIVEGFRTNQCCDLNMHAKVLCDLLDSILTDLQQASKIAQARCMDIGGSHVSMNEKCCGSLWDQLGECLAEKVSRGEPSNPVRLGRHVRAESPSTSAVKPEYHIPSKRRTMEHPQMTGDVARYTGSDRFEADQSKTVHLMPIDNRGVQLIIPLSQPVQPVDLGKAIPPTETTYSLLSPPMSSQPSPAAQFSNGTEEFTLLEGSGYPSSSINVTAPAEKPTSLENDIDYALLDEFFVKQDQWH